MGIKTVKNKINILKTSNTFLSILLLGLSLSITGPCLLDLQRLVNTDAQHIAFLYTSRSLGFLMGAILATNLVIIQIWGSGPALQNLHFCFGFGAFISPLIAAPFLEDQTNHQNLYNYTNYSSHAYFNTNTTTNFSENNVHEGTAKLVYPFSIIGLFGVLVTTLFFITWVISPYEDSESQTKESSLKNSFFFMFSAFFIFLVFFVVSGTQCGFGQTLATYAVKSKLQVSAAVASYMTSAYWAALMTMRMICVFLSIKFSSMTLLRADICLIAVAGVMLLFAMPNEGVLWAVAVIFGSGIASSYASLIGWLSNYIKITSKISAILTVGCAAGEMVIPFIIAFFVETVPDMLGYVVSSSSIVSTIIILILYAIFKQEKKKCTPIETKCYVISLESVIT